MAHNRSPSKLRSDMLRAPLAVYRGWLLEVACASDRCPKGRATRIDALLCHYPDATLGATLNRLRCVVCGCGPVEAVLTEVRAGRRVPLRGSECGY